MTTWHAYDSEGRHVGTLEDPPALVGTCGVCHRADVRIELAGHAARPDLLACVDEAACFAAWRANKAAGQ